MPDKTDTDLGDPREAISCLDCLNAIFYCMSPRHQFRSYYREGAFDKCDQQYADMRFCVKLKTAPKNEALDLLKELAKEEPSPTLGSVWTERKPGEPGF